MVHRGINNIEELERIKNKETKAEYKYIAK
jgi:hypothetical protein